MIWISVNDKLPPLDQPILLSDGEQWAKGYRNDWNTRNPWSASEEGVAVTPIDGNCASLDLDFVPTHWAEAPVLPNTRIADTGGAKPEGRT